MKMAAPKSSSRPGKNANEPQPKRRQEGHAKAPIVPMKGERANQSTTKAKNARPPMLRLRQILGLTTGDARIKTMEPVKCS